MAPQRVSLCALRRARALKIILCDERSAMAAAPPGNGSGINGRDLLR